MHKDGRTWAWFGPILSILFIDVKKIFAPFVETHG
jgi:hypothetical protein